MSNSHDNHKPKPKRLRWPLVGANRRLGDIAEKVRGNAQSISELQQSIDENLIQAHTNAKMDIAKDLIQLYDNLRYLKRKRRRGSRLMRPRRKCVRPEDKFAEEIVRLLGMHGVTIVTGTGNAVDYERQHVDRQVPTSEPSLHGTVVEEVRPGFIGSDNVLIRPQHVAVAVCRRAPSNNTEKNNQ